MESNSWLVPLISGLMLDIAGIIILTGPLFKISHKFYNLTINPNDIFDESDSLNDSFKIATSKFSETDKIDKGIQIMSKKLFQKHLVLEINTLGILFKMLILTTLLQDRKKFRTAIFALIVIITGFFLQIIGNFMNQ